MLCNVNTLETLCFAEIPTLPLRDSHTRPVTLPHDGGSPGLSAQEGEQRGAHIDREQRVVHISGRQGQVSCQDRGIWALDHCRDGDQCNCGLDIIKGMEIMRHSDKCF